MKRKTLAIYFVIITITAIANNVFAVGGDMGTGTEPLTDGSPAYPYLIEDIADFDVFADPANSATYWAAGVHAKLTTNIDLATKPTYTTAVIAPDTPNTDSSFNGIPFQGIFDGDGHTISNLTINPTGASNDYLGLFGSFDGGGEIKNLGAVNCNINGGNSSDFVGGLCGENRFSTITNCYATGSVKGASWIGGLCGSNHHGTITNSNTTSFVTGWNGSDYVGGLCGWSVAGTITNCYTTGSVNGYDNVGGLCGKNWGTITNCYATGDVTGNSKVGGLIGANYSDISQCYSTGSVTGTNDIGGLIGSIGSGYIVSNCYSQSDVIGLNANSNVGGIAGACPGATLFRRCYAAGTVSGIGHLGGFLGIEHNYANYDSCFWDADKNPTLNSIGNGSRTGDPNIMPETTANMQTKSTFAGWDFVSTWWIDDGVDYPELAMQTGDMGGGSGTESDPYLIENITDFDVFAGDPNYWALDVYTKLITNIDLATKPTYTTAVIAPGGGDAFQGIFDGDGHTISNLTIDTAGASNGYLGLFGVIDGVAAEVKNLGIVDCDITGGNGSRFLGGLCGKNGSTITNCYAAASVTEGIGLGGLCGWNDGTVTDSYATGSVDGHGILGGLCGANEATITNSYATGSVNGMDFLGGLCGKNFGTVTNSYATGSVTGGGRFGGLCGTNSGTIINCYATGSVDGRAFFGGLCGVNESGQITNSYATGSVNGSNIFGGLCGNNEYGTITNCYSTGRVAGVAASYGLGGLCGISNGTITSCFWDTETSDMTVGVGDGPSAGAVGKTTADMQMQTTFSDVPAIWDFVGTWWINDGQDYPKLYFQPFGDLNNDSHVNLVDFAILAGQWQLEDLLWDIAPSNGDGIVNLLDFAAFAGTWTGSAEDFTNLAVFAGQWLQRGAYSADIAPVYGGDGVVGILDLQALVENWLQGPQFGLPQMIWVDIDDDPGVPGHEPFNGDMSRYETTNSQYCVFLNAALASGDITVDANALAVYGAEGSNAGEDFVDEKYLDTHEAFGSSQITYSGGTFTVLSRDTYDMSNYPVIRVSWYGATAFCNYYGYTLPTQWQWQAVADHDGTFTYGCGTTIDQSKANYALDDGTYCNPLSLSDSPYLTPVNYFASYGYRVNDMAGNVWEWTSTAVKSNRVVRGGCWYNYDSYCEVSRIASYFPHSTYSSLGFRVCR